MISKNLWVAIYRAGQHPQDCPPDMYLVRSWSEARATVRRFGYRAAGIGKWYCASDQFQEYQRWENTGAGWFIEGPGNVRLIPLANQFDQNIKDLG